MSILLFPYCFLFHGNHTFLLDYQSFVCDDKCFFGQLQSTSYFLPGTYHVICISWNIKLYSYNCLFFLFVIRLIPISILSSHFLTRSRRSSLSFSMSFLIFLLSIQRSHYEMPVPLLTLLFFCFVMAPMPGTRFVILFTL